MKKSKYIVILMIIFLAGCSANLSGGIKYKQLNLKETKIYIGGEELLGASLELNAINFKPEAIMEKWDNVQLKIWRDEKGEKTATQVADKLIWKAESGNEYRFYTKSKEELKAEAGGFEYEVVLKKNPKSNVIEFNISADDLLFYRLNGLTDYERSMQYTVGTKEDYGGIYMPPEAEGSYAVYHKTYKNYDSKSGINYKTGKFGHIYRPKLIDAKGNWIWAEMKINTNKKGELIDNKLVIIMDISWLDKAEYPIIVDPTFGETGIGVTSRSYEGLALGMPFTLSEAGSVSKLTAYVKDSNGDFTSVAAIYDSSHDLVAITSEVDLPLNSAAWTDFTFSSAVSLSAGSYFLTHHGYPTGGGACRRYEDGGGSIYQVDDRTTYGFTTTWPDPICTCGSTCGGKCVYALASVYATYTASGGATAPRQEEVMWFN